MGIRLAKENEFQQVLEIFEQAKQILKNDGIDQWQNGYPNMEVIRQDFAKKQLYVYIDDEQSDEVVATCVVSYDIKEQYENAMNVNWAVNGKYAAVHRVAVSTKAKRKGYAQELMRFAYEQAKNQNCKSVRVDTHADNKRMQKVLDKTGYTFRGVITYDKNGDVLRNAYDIVIS